MVFWGLLPQNLQLLGLGESERVKVAMEVVGKMEDDGQRSREWREKE